MLWVKSFELAISAAYIIVVLGNHGLVVCPFAFSMVTLLIVLPLLLYMLNELKRHQGCSHGCHHHQSPNKGSFGITSEDGDADTDLEEDGHESESQEEQVSEEEVQADFAFFDPKPDDFHGVKTLLQTYLDGKQWDLSSFVDLILAQTTVGTVIKLEDDEDNGSFAIATALNLGRYKESKCIMEVEDYLVKSCDDAVIANTLKVLVEDEAEQVGLLVSQSVTNLPPQLLPHLYDEISWATEDEPTEELCKSFRFKHFLLLSRIYKKKAQTRKVSANTDEEDIIYIRAEDELLHKLCSWCFSFSLQSQPPAAQELKGYQLNGLVMANKADKIAKFRKQLRSLIDDS